MKYHGVDPLEHESDQEIINGLQASRIVHNVENRRGHGPEVVVQGGNAGNDALLQLLNRLELLENLRENPETGRARRRLIAIQRLRSLIDQGQH